MSMPILNDDDIVRILMAGGGLRLKTAFKTVDTLARFAMAAKSKNARLTLEVTTILNVDDLARIGLAGGGAVSFEWPN